MSAALNVLKIFILTFNVLHTSFICFYHLKFLHDTEFFFTVPFKLSLNHISPVLTPAVGAALPRARDAVCAGPWACVLAPTVGLSLLTHACCARVTGQLPPLARRVVTTFTAACW